MREYLFRPLQAWDLLRCRFIHPAVLRHRRGVTIKGRVILTGIPMIEVRNGGHITLENEVLLRSDNRGYHVNMHSPVKLLADRPGAEIVIGEQSQIYGSCIHAYHRITIGKRCLVAANCEIFDGSGHEVSFPQVENRIFTKGSSRPITIEDYVWLGCNCIVLPGVTIGRGSVIGAGSVVARDIPPMVVAAGNPAVVVKDCSGT
ncbi:MAG TPA: acyltransferase [Phycisphaerae bacterium]|nr:acyltransferase [Phycisphaerae bacterium]HNU44274.1 acyltransferase [Phycisphaerae bacterium]